MQPEEWLHCFRSLEEELSAFFSPEELVPLMRRAGRSCGDPLAGGEIEPALSQRGLPLEPVDGGYRIAGGSSPVLALAAWSAGFLEGIHPEHRKVRIDGTGSGSVRLAWAAGPRLTEDRMGFTLSSSGPLTPFQLAQVADLSADAVLFVDQNRRFRAWNRGATEMFGYTPEEAVGQYYNLLVPPDLDQVGELERIDEETRSHGTLRNYITRRRTKDGRELIVSLTRTMIQDRRGQAVGFGIILRDISAEERLKTQLDGARQLAQVGELASQVAHELRNPLASIHGALQILRRRLKPGPEEDNVFEDVAGEIMRLDRLVTDLLRFGRPTAPRLQRTNLEEWLEAWKTRIDREAGERGVQVTLELPEAVPVELDGNLLEQVLRNLFENAVEASPAGSRIDLRLDRDGDRARLRFSDTGPGVPAELHGKVLEPFFTTKVHGSGLGLAVCRKNLTAMGGLIRLVPDAHGALFEIELPLASAG